MTNPTLLAALLFSLACLLPTNAVSAAGDDHNHDEAAHAHADDHDDVQISLTAKMQQLNRISTEIAGRRTLVQHTALFGVIKAIPTAQYQIRAPYAGTLQQVLVQQGDSVSKGQLLARLTNATTLKSYTIHAPADGVIAERYFNDQQQVRDDVLLSLVDYSKVYVELSAFPNDIQQLQTGMPLTVFSLHHDQSANSNISYIAPQMTAGHIARMRAVLDNQSGYWRPGMHVKALVQTAEIPVELAVKKQALQRIEGKAVLFVRENDVFTAIQPEFGREDASYIEVVSGLAAGSEYASDNSFVLKADALKSGASHAH
ncbi:efflux RND transporter periplasmic adaptor subunit [Rheinheimera muenzenbergensis]|uniref:Efflux RND transporter periplasmic adaptor subunit n=1 Tax=Rheinheimera muenzenbergensis TaxID=1193628 RepID=A0ABU8CBP9_9GAMM